MFYSMLHTHDIAGSNSASRTILNTPESGFIEKAARKSTLG
jgi:hypothetical protein